MKQNQKIEYKNLRRICKEEIDKAKIDLSLKLSTEEGLSQYLKWEHKIYKTNPKEKLLKYLNNKLDKRLIETLKQIQTIEETPDYSNDREIIITIEWVKSRMWGYNPKASDNYSKESDNISGCGYDKESTATSQILNQHPEILKLLYTAKEKVINSLYVKQDQDTINRTVLGYGSGYNILPKFEGGVGVDCHKRILENVGLRMEHISNTKHTDVYRIFKPNKSRGV